MSDLRLRVVLSTLVLVGAATTVACDPPVDVIQCTGTALDPTAPAVTVAVAGTPQLYEDDSKIVVHGTAAHELGLAIRRVTVAGMDAKSTSFNFAGWSADLPAEIVRDLVPAGAKLPTDVTVDLIAYDACSGTTAAAQGSVRIHLAAAEADAPDAGPDPSDAGP